MENQNSKQAIIIDIDNTLFNQNNRKAYVLNLAAKKYPIAKLTKRLNIDDDFDLQLSLKKFNNLAKEGFWEMFFSENHYRDDNGKYTIDLYEDCSTCVNELIQDFDIIYLTSRKETTEQRTELIRQLTDFQLPVPNGTSCLLYMMDTAVALNSVESFNNSSIEFKSSKLKELRQKHEILAGVGDTYQDMIAYSDNDITSIMLNTHYKTLNKDSQHDLVFLRWNAIKLCIEIISNPKSLNTKDIPFLDLIENSTKEYSSYLGNLDAKTRLLLAIDTALFGFSAIALGKSTDNLLDIFLYVALALIAISMFFCIKAFSSKNIKTSRNGTTISYGFDNNISRVIRNKKPVPKGSPIEMHEELKEAKHKRQHLADIQFFYEAFNTLDLRSIYNLRLYQVRSLNYVKIYSEVWGRRFLFLGLGFVLLSFSLMVFNKLNGKPEVQIKENQSLIDNISAESEISFNANTSNNIEI